MEQKITNALASEILDILIQASQQKKMPIKFCIAKNIKLLQEPVDTFSNRKDELFKEAVKLDDNGNAVVAEEFRTKDMTVNSRFPYTSFEYNSEESRKNFFEKISALNREELELTFITERADRSIKISNEDGSYTDSTVQEVLEDPNNEVTPALIRLFIEYFLEI